MEKNELYPVFLKVNTLETLIVGAGNVGLEKLGFLLKSSPNARVTVVAKNFHPELAALALQHKVNTIKASYDPVFLEAKHLVIACTDDPDLNIQVYMDCRIRNILVNVADKPTYCDFYMGGIVTRGNLKLAISTNGKSPTTAKRLRQFFEEVIPEDINELLENLNVFRNTIKGDFEEKVNTLNDLTKGLISKKK
ncbi:MAG: bifunctional precorrin-2 dehydrogenase/sirohydrochlorin ferrochelatase [Flavobacteriaceae bacterium]|nr:bifunctional precorrin-2 dehydrogenase/sirohydrochlorin ferrochelatase [Flavobacteriaceae bacterium]